LHRAAPALRAGPRALAWAVFAGLAFGFSHAARGATIESPAARTPHAGAARYSKRGPCIRRGPTLTRRSSDVLVSSRGGRAAYAHPTGGPEHGPENLR
ncbi:hypothetical protein ACWD6I_25200, partial [Streptomyces sp. NPDC002454]